MRPNIAKIRERWKSDGWSASADIDDLLDYVERLEEVVDAARNAVGGYECRCPQWCPDCRLASALKALPQRGSDLRESILTTKGRP